MNFDINSSWLKASYIGFSSCKDAKENMRVIMNKIDHFKVYMTQNFFITLLGAFKMMKNALFYCKNSRHNYHGTVVMSITSLQRFNSILKKIFRDIPFCVHLVTNQVISLA